MKVNYEKLFPDEFKNRLLTNPTAYLPLGSLEYHGYQNVLGLDSLKAKRICEIVAKKIGGIVLPALYLGFDTYPDLDIKQYTNKGYDCYSIDREIYKKILLSYILRLKTIGFKNVFILAGHYPNANVAKEALESIKGIKINVFTEFELLSGETGDHAGKWETSLMMYLFPKCVDLTKMSNKPDYLNAIVGENPTSSSYLYGKVKIKAVVNKIISIIQSSLTL